MDRKPCLELYSLLVIQNVADVAMHGGLRFKYL